MFLIAHNIRSLHNIGAFFRNADAFGVAKLFLTGYSGIPPRKEISKTALGSEHRVAWEYDQDIFTVIEKLKQQGIQLIAFETGNRSVSVQNLFLSEKNTALIFGNEVEGLPLTVLDLCDNIVEIPMIGAKKSLNVSVACGIALFAIRQKMS